MNIKKNKNVSKKKPILAGVRLLTIERFLREEGSIRVTELSRVLNVSEVTIRRDLDALEQGNQIRRVHGGAIIFGDEVETSNFFSQRLREHKEEKQRIGQVAAALINDGDVVILNAGTTTTQLARSIVVEKKELTVITNGVNIALELSKNSGITVILTGGTFRKTTLSLTGPKVAESLKDLNVEIFFISVQGISIERGLTSASFSDLDFKRAAMRAAKEVIVTADSSKFGNIEFCTIASLSEVQKIITDSKVSKNIVKQLKDHRVELIVV